MLAIECNRHAGMNGVGSPDALDVRASSCAGISNCLEMLAVEAKLLGLPLAAMLIAAASVAVMDGMHGNALTSHRAS